MRYKEYGYFTSFFKRLGYSIWVNAGALLIVDRSKGFLSLPNEKWNDFYDYKVSNLGRIINKYGRLQAVCVGNTGRNIFNPYINGKRRNYLLARIVAMLFVPNPHNKPEVNHINGIPTDDRAENLEWVSRQENIDHAIEHKLFYNNNPNRPKHRTTSPDSVKEIRELYATGLYTYKTLSDKFGVSKSVVGKIVRRDSWKNIS